MVYLKKKFKNHVGQYVYLALDSWKHITEKHPEISLEEIKQTRVCVDEYK